ncbi:type II toxin-antitoxin system ParD family antitoxin [filamentous cyanobacterium CCT1]|nr:type II toxin-antitoxin system ParD family antitoxin [filamentous cyanobacterium CCT1]PSN79840.1 type II toxin-antitoxin system ParD family antitoxin [filamentous cyanobacterium CCP4]
MDVSLGPEQTKFIEAQISKGRYGDPEEVIDRALSLLAEWEKSYDQWLQETRQKVDEGLRQIETGEVLDGEIVMAQLREKIQKAQEDAG